MKIKSIFMMLFLLFILSGCSDPLPQSKIEYAGEWRSKEMTLLILEDSTVAYKRIKAGGSVSINAPLKEFVGDDFIVGVLFFTTTFDVTEPPNRHDGKWQMVVDGVRLTRVEE